MIFYYVKIETKIVKVRQTDKFLLKLWKVDQKQRILFLEGVFLTDTYILRGYCSYKREIRIEKIAELIYEDTSNRVHETNIITIIQQYD